jgi:hypothetical protein
MKLVQKENEVSGEREIGQTKKREIKRKRWICKGKSERKKK